MADEQAAEGHTPGRAVVHWEGDSREVLAGFPKEVRGNLGFALYRLQLGKQPTVSTRRMEAVGAGVYELKEGD
jgi:phage-related protein